MPRLPPSAAATPTNSPCAWTTWYWVSMRAWRSIAARFSVSY